MHKHPHTDEPISPLMTEFSNYIANALRRKLPPEVTKCMKIRLVDTFAAMISGSRLLPGKSPRTGADYPVVSNNGSRITSFPDLATAIQALTFAPDSCGNSSVPTASSLAVY